ncbi:hypothetical protein CWI36_2117p0010, partial [Hamiltosporidium magnivora]
MGKRKISGAVENRKKSRCENTGVKSRNFDDFVSSSSRTSHPRVESKKCTDNRNVKSFFWDKHAKAHTGYFVCSSCIASKKITLLDKRVEKLEEEEKRYKKTLMLAKTNSIALEVHFKEIEKLRKVPKRDPQADPAVSELVCNAAELTEKHFEQNLVVNEAKSQSFGPTLSARYAMAKARSLDKQIVLRTDSSTDLTANAVDSLAVGVCPAEVLICIAAESQNLQIKRAMNVSHQGARLVECGTGNTTLPPIATPRSIEKKLP